MSRDDYNNGLKVRTEVMGEHFVKRAQDNTVPLQHHCRIGLTNMHGARHGNVTVFYHANTAH